MSSTRPRRFVGLDDGPPRSNETGVARQGLHLEILPGGLIPGVEDDSFRHDLLAVDKPGVEIENGNIYWPAHQRFQVSPKLEEVSDRNFQLSGDEEGKIQIALLMLLPAGHRPVEIEDQEVRDGVADSGDQGVAMTSNSSRQLLILRHRDLACVQDLSAKTSLPTGVPGSGVGSFRPVGRGEPIRGGTDR